MPMSAQASACCRSLTARTTSRARCTRFWASARAARRPRRAHERGGFGMALILVIDDDEAMRRLIMRTLSAAKHRLVEASNGQDGMKMVGELKPDAVITDILMPQQEGIQTIREI